MQTPGWWHPGGRVKLELISYPQTLPRLTLDERAAPRGLRDHRVLRGVPHDPPQGRGAAKLAPLYIPERVRRSRSWLASMFARARATRNGPFGLSELDLGPVVVGADKTLKPGQIGPVQGFLGVQAHQAPSAVKES